MRHPARGCVNVLLGLMALLPLAAVSGEPDLRGVGDPTKPPPGVLARQFGGGGASADDAAAAAAAVAAASAASAAAAEAAAEAKALALTGIRINLGNGEGVAVVGDEVVKVGDKVRGMTVVSITHDTVELKGPAGARRLKLPDVIDQSRAPARAAKRGRKDKK
ncbi:MAG: hypothetical protein HY019_10925 [Aquabacterium sp.]|uniref:hypothetical protein n=1 Tax=Aquabacterium sp. TaxID=1872578 RepID=UPI0025C0C94B|nr:hypothetical protein [Aquabacterium sp.]MBI3382507.1 hypothetical protein [Aquabacterium sp.]